MKRQIISWGMMLVAAFTLTNCAKEIENPNQQPEQQGYPFEIVASTVDTKTVNDGMATKWAEGDKINLFHAVTGGEDYINDANETLGAFTFTSDDIFKGQLAESLTSGSYDWYALYPYSKFTTTPSKSGYLPIGCEPAKSTNQVQVGNSNMKHISGPNYPLWGNVTAIAHDERPSIPMSHVASLIKVVVENTTEEPLTVESVAFTAPVDVVGTYYITFNGDVVSCENSGEQYVSKTATLDVNEGEEIPAGKSADFYLAVRPFTAEAGTSLSLAVNGYAKEPKILESDVTFHAGKIKTLNFAYDYVAPAGEQSVTFDFTSADELNALGVTLPDVDGGTNVTTLTKGDVTFVAEGGSTKTRVYNSKGDYDLRAYKGATLTFTVPTGYVISDIIVEGSATTGISKSTMPNNPVVLTVAADASTQKISTVTVKYIEGEVEAVPLTMTEIACVNTTANSLTFSWDAVTGAEGYKVSLDGGNTYGDLFTATSYTWDDLEAETDYIIYIKAIGNDINTLDSEAVSAQGTTAAEQVGIVTMTAEFSFIGTNGQKDFSVTEAPIQIAFAQGGGSYAPNDHTQGHVRIYNKNTMTFTGGTIVKIELEYSSDNYSGAGTTANVGTLSQNTETKTWTWVGKSTSVTLTGGNTQGRYISIIVYYESDGTMPDPVQLTMSDITCSDKTANSLTFKWDIVANASGYEVSFNGGEAETITGTVYTAEGLAPETEYEISVKAVGDGTYYLTSAEKTCSETTESEEVDDTEKVWTLVTDASTLQAGDIIRLGCSAKGAAAGAMGAGKFFTSVSATYINDTMTSDSAIDITLGGESGAWTLTTSEGTIGTSAAKALKLDGGTTTWTIDIASGVATIKSTTASYGWIQFNSGSPRFLNYTSNQTAIQIYRYE